MKTELLVKPTADRQYCPGRQPELRTGTSCKSHLPFASDSWPSELKNTVTSQLSVSPVTFLEGQMG